MSEQLLRRQRRRELLITLAFTAFSALMIIVSAIESWPIFYIPLLMVEIVIVWLSYSRGFSSYTVRAVMLTVFICLNIILYGIQGVNFFVLIPTLCVEIVLLSLYEMIHVMVATIIQTIFLFVFHVLKGNFVLPDNSLERNRLILQLMSLVAVFWLCIYRIHHHIQEEVDFASLEDRVRQEQKIKDDFVANTSHELRTPINTISGMCEILLQKALPDDTHRSVLDIQMTGVELKNIVTDILDYSALESGTLELTPRSYSITSTLNDVMNMTVYENRDKQLEIIFDCDPNIPSLLEGDEQQLRRILNNLISNAIKFTNEGGVTVSVTYRPEAYGINLIVSVKDTGVGISDEERTKVLRGFYQTDADRNRKSTGMGLGLTITSALIKKMDGFLTIRSQAGRGSEFSFAIPQKVLDDQPCISLLNPAMINLVWYYIPQSPVPSMRDSFVDHIRHFSDYFGIISQQAASLEECKRRVAQAQNAQLILGRNEYLQDKEYFDNLAESSTVIVVSDRSENAHAASQVHVLYKPYNAMMLAEILNGREASVTQVRRERKRFVAPTAKILVVDDNLMNLKVVEGLLRRYRIKIVPATSGEEALSLIDSQDYDFVFMDHMMPGMDGVECFHRIREKQGTYFAQVPIIALTANAIAGSREMFLAEGFNDFVAKPIDTALLGEVLQRFIPLEKQMPEEEAEPLPELENAPLIPETPKVDPFAPGSGIDRETALLYCGSVEDFRELADVYCESGKAYTLDLDKAYASKDMKSYAILAHTIKSTSKTLGAKQLSDLAFAQEMAAKDENEGLVLSQHEEFSAEYERVLKLLRSYLGEEGDAPQAEAPQGEAPTEDAKELADWDGVKSELLEHLKSFEATAFEDRVKALRGHLLNGVPIEEALASVAKKASNFDFEGAIAALNEIGGQA